MKEDTDTVAQSAFARELFVLSAGGRLFAVFAEETDGVAENVSPVPLPHAPAAVLGVVSVRGRMRTVLYPPALFDDGDAQTPAHAATPRFVVALRGDEQLALAADSVEDSFTADAEDLIDANTDADSSDAGDSHTDSPAPPLRAALERGGRRVHLLDTSRVFGAAMRGTERRRPRR